MVWEFEDNDELTWQDDARLTGIDVVWEDVDGSDDNITIQHISNSEATNVTVTVGTDSESYALDVTTGSTTIDKTSGNSLLFR